MSALSVTAAAELANASYDLTLPVRVSLGAGLPAITCERLLRLLPGRRMVLAGRWREGERETAVVLKLFFGKKTGNKEWQQEMDGYQRLCEAMLTVPACLMGWEADDGEVAAIIYEFVDGRSLFDLWQSAPTDAQRTYYMLAAARVVATMHDHGLRQVDIHLDNFLMSGDTLYTLDAGSISQHQSPLPQALAIENLADLLAQVPARFDGAGRDDGQVAQAVAAYNTVNPCYVLTATNVQATTEHMRAIRWRHYHRKLTRTCTEFMADSSWRTFSVVRRDNDSAALRAVLADPDAALEAGERLKSGNTATVARINVNGRHLVIKRYNLKNWRHALGRCWRPSRAWQSWHNAYHLRFAGINTPLPIALLEERCGPARGRAFLITDYVAGPDLFDVVKARSESPCPTETIDSDLLALFDGLYTAKLSHGDMKANNLLVTANGISVIDLDSMTTHSSYKSLQAALRRDLKRFLKNWQSNNFPASTLTHYQCLLGDIARQLAE